MLWFGNHLSMNTFISFIGTLTLCLRLGLVPMTFNQQYFIEKVMIAAQLIVLVNIMTRLRNCVSFYE